MAGVVYCTSFDSALVTKIHHNDFALHQIVYLQSKDEAKKETHNDHHAVATPA